MKYTILISVLFIAAISCNTNETPKSWVFENSVLLDGVHPIGIALRSGELWLSDGDGNRLVHIDENGKTLGTIDSLDRPMHIAADATSLFVPQYGRDSIAIIGSGEMKSLSVSDSLDAPAGISVFKKEKAIADFYNNRILYNNGSEWSVFGQEGKSDGEFYYPTDVQITEDNIWVADAYNNRVQVFDKQGIFVKKFGEEQKINAATGIYVSATEVFVTDFENNRVLVFDREGRFKQTLNEGIEKPTDMLIKDEKLLIINYASGKLTTYHLGELQSQPQ